MKYSLLEIAVVGGLVLAIIVGIKSLVDSKEPRVWTDDQTGCQFIIVRNRSITPRVDADGIHMGCKGLQGDRK